jgi:type IV secretion system protein TrbL
MGCPSFLSWFCSAAGDVGSGVANSVLTVIADAVVDAEKWVIGQSLALWTDIKTPGVSSPGELFLHTYTVWFVGFVGVLGLLIAAIRLALERRAEPAKLAARGLVNLAVVTGGGVAIISLGTQAGDAYSTWIIDQALNQKGSITNPTTLAILSVTGLPVFLLIVFGLVGLLASIAQIFLLAVRIGMLGLLAGLLPIAAAASTTESGRAWFSKFCSWILAFLLYKPVAATIYAYALIPLTSNSFVEQLVGIVMLIVTVVALPALMRMITPMVAAATHQGGSGAGAAFTALAVALGARALRPGDGADGAAPTGDGRAGLSPSSSPPGGDSGAGAGAGAGTGAGAGAGAGADTGAVGGAGAGAGAGSGAGVAAGSAAADTGAAAAATGATGGLAAPLLAAALVGKQVAGAANSAAAAQAEGGGPSGSG